MKTAIVPAAILTIGLAACGGSARPHANTVPGHSSKSAAAPASPALAANKAVCQQFNTGVLDETDIIAVLNQFPAVSPAVARDYLAVGNSGTTLHSAMTAQIHMTMDCAIVSVGRIPPNTTWPPGS